jgi:hypothetical protein
MTTRRRRSDGPDASHTRRPDTPSGDAGARHGGDDVTLSSDGITTMADRLRGTSDRVETVTRRVENVQLGPEAMGMLGTNFTGAARSHMQVARDRLGQARDAVRHAEEGTRRTAQSYVDTDEASATSLSSIDTHSETPNPGGSSTTTPSSADSGGSTSGPPPPSDPGAGGDQPVDPQHAPRPPNPDEPHAPLSQQEQADLSSRRTDLEQQHQQRFDELKQDPDHNNKVNKNSMEEARTALDLEQRGEEGFADGNYRRPSGPGQGEFIDGNGRHWDIKGIHSDWPPGVPESVRNSRPFPNAYTEADFRATLTDQFAKGRGVIIDTRNADQTAIDNMRTVVEEEGWGGNVIWYP